jgi:hypothetical protein
MYSYTRTIGMGIPLRACVDIIRIDACAIIRVCVCGQDKNRHNYTCVWTQFLHEITCKSNKLHVCITQEDI